MDYHSFFAGFVSAIFVASCMWLLTVLRTDTAPQIPEPPAPEPAPEPKPKPARKRHARQTKKA